MKLRISSSEEDDIIITVNTVTKVQCYLMIVPSSKKSVTTLSNWCTRNDIVLSTLAEFTKDSANYPMFEDPVNSKFFYNALIFKVSKDFSLTIEKTGKINNLDIQF